MVFVEPHVQVEYFRKKYGENPRSDILGIDGCALFVLIYIVAADFVRDPPCLLCSFPTGSNKHEELQWKQTRISANVCWCPFGITKRVLFSISNRDISNMACIWCDINPLTPFGDKWLFHQPNKRVGPFAWGRASQSSRLCQSLHLVSLQHHRHQKGHPENNIGT